MTDWRRQGQEAYLNGVDLCRSPYSPYRKDWEHDHCEFCGGKFALSNGDFTEGYRTLSSYYWICTNCFNDFKTDFSWNVVPCEKRQE